MRRRFFVAVVAAVIVATASPFVGEIRAAVERVFPDQYLSIVLVAVLLPVIVAIGAAVFHIRDRRRLRYGLFGAAAVLGVLYATVMQTVPTEQFHFIEYGVIAILFYRAWRWSNDVAAIVLPACAALVTGFADEWVQWFVPSRVGEGRDVVLNGIGVVCGLLVATAFDPPMRLAMREDTRRRLAAGVTAVALTGALVVQTIHFGYEIRDRDVGTFRSRFDAPTLRALAETRGELWRRQPPPAEMPLVSREDHYLAEALFHVRWRNDAVSRADRWTAWKENLILERFYLPVLELAPDMQWPSEQRETIAATSALDARPYVSQAYPFPIYAWNRALFWGGITAGLAALWMWAKPRAAGLSPAAPV